MKVFLHNLSLGNSGGRHVYFLQSLWTQWTLQFGGFQRAHKVALLHLARTNTTEPGHRKSQGRPTICWCHCTQIEPIETLDIEAILQGVSGQGSRCVKKTACTRGIGSLQILTGHATSRLVSKCRSVGGAAPWLHFRWFSR